MNLVKLILLTLPCFQLSLGCYATAVEAQHIDDARLVTLKHAFLAYAAINGHYPQGENWQIVQELQNPKTGIRFSATKTDARGNLLDLNENPYVFFFSKEGWVLIASLSKDKTTIERYVLVPPLKEGKP